MTKMFKDSLQIVFLLFLTFFVAFFFIMDAIKIQIKILFLSMSLFKPSGADEKKILFKNLVVVTNEIQ